MRVCLYGVEGKVGSVLGPGLEQAGHVVVDGRAAGPAGCDAAVDFTRPDAVQANAEACFAAGVPLVVGTTGFDTSALDAAAASAGVACLHVPNFSLGAVLMMRFAEEAARVFPAAEIVELHADTKVDAPSGTAKATAERMGGAVPIHSVRLPGPRRPPGGRLRRPGGDAHDPPRHELPRGVRPGCPPRARGSCGRCRPASPSGSTSCRRGCRRTSPLQSAVLGEILTAMVTPFRADGSLDLPAFRSLCGFLLDNGSDGLVVTGTTGEAPTLSDDERFALYEAALEVAAGRGTVVAGTGTYSTAHSIHLTQRAHELGVDGVLVVTPYYNKPPQRGIVAHVEAVAAATDRPVIFYDIPSRVVVDAEPATISTLAEIENVRGVKQAKPSLDAARHVVDCGLDLYAGDDDLVLPFLEVGGVGGICVYTHVVGPQVKELVTRLPRRETSTGRASSTRSCAPRSSSCACRRTRSRSSGRSSCSGTRSAGCASRSSRPTRRRPSRSAAASSVSACSRPSPLRLRSCRHCASSRSAGSARSART